MAGANWSPKNLAGVTRGGTPNYSKAINSTGAVLHPYLQSVAKMNMRAGAQLGGAVQQVGAELTKVNDALNAAENLGQSARLENMIKEERIGFAEDTVGMPLEEKTAAWNARHKNFEGKIAEMGLSPDLAQRAGIASEAFNQEQQIGIRKQALSDRNEENKTEILSYAEESFVEGNWANYESVMREAERTGYIQVGSLDGPDGLLAKRKQEFDVNEVVAMGYRDPKGTRAFFNVKDVDGNPLHYPDMDIDKRAAVERKLTTFDNRRKNEILTNLLADHGEDKPESFALVDALVKDGTFEHAYGKYVKQELSSIAPQPLDMERYLGVKKAIADADLTNDPTDAVLFGLQKQMLGFPPTATAELVSDLTAARGNASGKSSGSEAYKHGHKLIYNKFSKFEEFGKYKKPKNELEPIDQKAYESAFLKQDQAHRFLREFENNNPKAGLEEVNKAVQSYMANPRQAAAAVGLRFNSGSTTPVNSSQRTKQALDLIKGEVMNRAAGVRTTSGSNAQTTAYFPGNSKEVTKAGLTSIEGGVLDAHDNIIKGNSTYEDYSGGKGEGYVTVAMDKDSQWFKDEQFLISEAHPGIVFKVMDNGSFGNGKTDKSWVDIAFTDPEKAKSFKEHGVRFEPVTAEHAEETWEVWKEYNRSKLSGTWEEGKAAFFEEPRTAGEVDRGMLSQRIRWENSADLIQQIEAKNAIQQSTTEFLPKDGSKKLDEEKQLNQDYVKLDLPAGSGLPTENSLFPKK